jgi:hypothetical protein
MSGWALVLALALLVVIVLTISSRVPWREKWTDLAPGRGDQSMGPDYIMRVHQAEDAAREEARDRPDDTMS